MSALQIKDEEFIIGKLQAIRGDIVDIEILTKIKYDSNTPQKVQDTVQRLKQNIFDLDISLSNEIV